jgi:hypothetical protein
MKKTIATLKILLLGAILLGVSIFFWQYVLSGLVLSCIFRGRYSQWITPIAALTIVLIWRLSMSNWPVHIGDSTVYAWYVDLLAGIVSWALASIFVGAGYVLPKLFIEGLNSRTPRQAEQIMDVNLPLASQPRTRSPQ